MVRSTVAGVGVIVRIAAALVALLSSSEALGDMGELYTFLGYEPGAGHYLVPPGGEGSATAYAGVVDFTAYYGFTHTLHVGARIRLTNSSDVHFSGAKVRVPDGTQSTGDVWSDHRALGLGALALYRVDT